MSAPADQRSIELEIGGMTCASCAARIEKRLARLDGVSASVNYATEKAKVTYPLSISTDQLVEQVVGAGYTAHIPAPLTIDTDHSGELARLRRRLLAGTLLTVPVVAIAMVPALQFDYWQWVSLALTAPVVFWGGSGFHHAALTNARHGSATMDTLISVGTLAAFGWSMYALIFGHAGMRGMRHSFSLAVQRGDSASNVYFEVAAGVIVFILAGRYFETRAKDRAGSALRALVELGAKDVAVLRDGVETRIPTGELRVGDLFLIRPGEKVATDGVVVEGSSALDRSLLTGESLPVEVGPGDTVVGATINSGGALTVRATRIGADTQLAQMAALVEEAQNGKAPVQRLADRVAAVFVPIVIAIALVTLGCWLLTGAATATAFGAAVAVLIIACPCALGLATPTALLVGTGRGAQLGILIKGPQILESTRRIDTVVLDKTGTVTTGRMTLTAIITVDEAGIGTAAHVEALAATAPLGQNEAADPNTTAAQADSRTTLERTERGRVSDPYRTAAHGEALAVPASAEHEASDSNTTASQVAGFVIAAPMDRDAAPRPRISAAAAEVLAIAAAVEDSSAHPVARAVVAGAREYGLTVAAATRFASHDGQGVTGVVDGRAVVVGRADFLTGSGITVPEALAAAKIQGAQTGTAVVVAWDGVARGVLVVADAVKPTSAEAVTELRRLGLTPVLLTGDNAAVAESVARAVGIDEVIADVLPSGKLDAVRALQTRGKVVAVVGDGVNDAAALAGADLGLAMGTGADVAIEASDITLVRGDLRTVGAAIRLSRATLRTIKANLFWAFAYNTAAIPLAAAGLLNPMLAGAAMALSSIFVVTNSLRLRTFT
ncbi:heavy metal translocating P-type ATPase [Nocardia sp. NPDC052566]|uniref:heavy metal translocating P-type ATPase n=1 Tax=Nocardia sp. NPDC052566 TaxID=3364330 RepID=UPI0037C55817